MEQGQLFTNIETVQPSERLLAMERAEAKARVEFKRSFYRFLIGYAERHDEWIAEDVAEAYKLTDLPQPDEWRATGGIIRRLVADNEIEATGRYRNSEARKSPMMIYRRRR